MILCCGEALIDLIPTTLESGETAFVPHTGGAVFNTAIALGRLGVDTALLSGVSTDAFGERIVQRLQENNVSTDHLIRSDNPTTLALLQVENGSASYSFYDEGSAGRQLPGREISAPPKNIDTVFCGGISLVNNPAADIYALIFSQLSANSIAMIDPNIRPGFISDESAYRVRLHQMLSHSDIVKVSDEDLQWIADSRGSESDQVQSIRDLGAKIVIVTKGEEGAVAYFQGDIVAVPTQPAKVEDTVGAGDTFNAGFLAELHCAGLNSKRRFEELTIDQLRSAVELGTKAASKTVSSRGAQPPWATELN